MRIKIKKEKLFLFALTLYLFWTNLLNGVKWRENYLIMINKLSTLLMATIIIMLLWCTLGYLNKNGKKQVITSIFMIISSIVTYYITGSNILVFFVLFVYSAADVDFDRIMHRYAIIQILCVIGVLVAYYLDMSVNVKSYFSYGVGNSIGTYHANNFASLVLSSYFAICYSFFKKNIKMECILATVIAFLLWNSTLSRTNCILIILYPIVHLLSSKNIFKSIISYRIMRYSIICLLGVSIVLTLFYNRIFGDSTDGTFLARFVHSMRLLKENGIHLFGNRIHYVSTIESMQNGSEAVILDSVYFKLLINFGIIATMFVLVVFSFSMSKAYSIKDREFLIIGSLFALSGITESLLIGVSLDFIVLACFAVYNPIENGNSDVVIDVFGDKEKCNK